MDAETTRKAARGRMIRTVLLLLGAGLAYYLMSSYFDQHPCDELADSFCRLAKRSCPARLSEMLIRADPDGDRCEKALGTIAAVKPEVRASVALQALQELLHDFSSEETDPQTTLLNTATWSTQTSTKTLKLLTNLNAPSMLEIDRTHVWWSAFYGNQVGRIPKGGGKRETVLSIDRPMGFVVEEGLFVATETTVLVNTTTVGRSEKVGASIARSGQHLFWVDQKQKAIMQSTLAGESKKIAEINSAGTVALVADETHIYFTDPGNDDVDGSVVGQVISGKETAEVIGTFTGGETDLAQDEERLYWFRKYSVRTARKKEGGAETLAVITSRPRALVASNVGIFWADGPRGASRILCTAKEGGSTQVVVSGLRSVMDLVVDDGPNNEYGVLYWLDVSRGGGTIWRVVVAPCSRG